MKIFWTILGVMTLAIVGLVWCKPRIASPAMVVNWLQAQGRLNYALTHPPRKNMELVISSPIVGTGEFGVTPFDKYIDPYGGRPPELMQRLLDEENLKRLRD
jgi:hypothetical protein